MTPQYTITEIYAPKSKPDKLPTYPVFIYLARIIFALGGNFFPKYLAKIAWKLFCTPLVRKKYKHLDSIGKSAERFIVPFEQEELQCYAWGKGSKTVLLAHGWEAAGLVMRHFVPSLVAKGFRVVAFDAPAHAYASSTQTNWVHTGMAIQTISNHLGGIHAIVAHSFGGGASCFALIDRNSNFTVDTMVFLAVPSALKSILLKTAKLLWFPTKLTNTIMGYVEQRYGYNLDNFDFSKQHHLTGVKNTLVVHDPADAIVPFKHGRLLAEGWRGQLLLTHGFGHNRILRAELVIDNVASYIALHAQKGKANNQPEVQQPIVSNIV